MTGARDGEASGRRPDSSRRVVKLRTRQMATTTNKSARDKHLAVGQQGRGGNGAWV